MFDRIEPPPFQQDGIVAMMKSVAADTRPTKVDLTVGLYKNALGETPLMRAVRQADMELAESRPHKAYVLPTGEPEFMSQMRDFSFGAKHTSRFVEGVQTPGASGALAVLLQLIRFSNPEARVWVSDPTYLNHIPTIRAMGLQEAIYPYLDFETMGFRKEAFHSWLKTLGRNDVVILHGCCHNPSGLHMNTETWTAVADAAERQGFFPLFDTAYQGLGDGIDKDREGLDIVLSRVERMALSISCSKSFSVYSDRVGCAFVVGKSQQEVEVAQRYLAGYSRPTYWVPPNSGAQVVAKVLSTPKLKEMWIEELAEIRYRVGAIRNDLKLALQEHTNSNKFDYVAENSGMFSMLPSSESKMKRLREEFAIYGLQDGRINIAALKESRIDYVAKSIAEVFSCQKSHSPKTSTSKQAIF
ncbi:MAG: aromatic amino acid transaminase [Pseudomonadota bacterium]